MTGIILEMRRIVAGVCGDEQQANAIVFALISHLGGERLYIPHNDYKERNQEMISLHKSGASLDQLASRYGLASKTVYRIVKRDR
jgi:Mor family transcriptional regulator